MISQPLSTVMTDDATCCPVAAWFEVGKTQSVVCSRQHNRVARDTAPIPGYQFGKSVKFGQPIGQSGFSIHLAYCHQGNKPPHFPQVARFIPSASSTMWPETTRDVTYKTSHDTASIYRFTSVSYTHLTLPTIYSV